MMILKQAAVASTLLSSLLILGSLDAAFGRLRGGIKDDAGGDQTMQTIQNDRSRYLSAQESLPTINTIIFGVAHGVTDTTRKASYGPRVSMSNPIVFANMMTYEDSSPSDTRVYEVTTDFFSFFVQEESSNDPDTTHGEENVGFMAIDLPSGDTAVIEGDNLEVVGKVGKFSTDQENGVITWENSNVDGNSDYVAIVMPNSYTDGEDPVHIRVTNVGVSTGKVEVDFNVEEWRYLSGSAHDDGHAETLDLVYMIVKVGVHTIQSTGRTLEAQIHSDVDHSFKPIIFEKAYLGTPVVLSQSQTKNGNHPIVTRMQLATDTGIEVCVQEEEVLDGYHLEEKFGLIIYGNLQVE